MLLRVNVFCLESRHPWLHVFFRLNYLSPSKMSASVACNYWPNLVSAHQVPITVDRGRVEYELFPTYTLLHITGTGNWTPNLLIFWFWYLLIPRPYSLGNVLAFGRWKNNCIILMQNSCKHLHTYALHTDWKIDYPITHVSYIRFRLEKTCS